MKNFLCLASMTVVLVAGTATPTKAQSCASSDSLATIARATVQWVVSSTDAHDVAFRQRLQLPASDTSAVTRATNDAVCQQVLAAVNAALTDWPAPLPTTIHVMAVGNYFVAMHPNPSPATREWDQYMVLNSQYLVVAKFVR